MNLSNSKYFLFLPHTDKEGSGTLYNLDVSNRYIKNSFVVLPYQASMNEQVPTFFYNIHSKTEVSDINLTSTKNISSSPIQLKATTSKEHYLDTLHELKKNIQQGNVYEINYCVEFFCEDVSINPFLIFLKLQALTKAPYSAFVKLNDDFILSASPELFLKKEGTILYTKPIKGTIKRGKNKEEDDQLKQTLHDNIKERTENVMAVDVARNDFSQLATKGSVAVNKLYNIESFETVHQMVSTVSCTLKENTPFHHIMAATFPMASMTGAPKLSAIQLIDKHEDFKRHFYSGAMGIIDENEDFTLSVIIRSIFYNQKTKRLSLAVGGAITYLSEPEKEYEECLLKAKALLKALDAVIV
jgi:para-aminobenzoate synthetase component I